MMRESAIHSYSPEFWRGLMAQFGPSFYLFDADWFLENITEFQRSFSRYHVNTRIAYSYKTNYHPRICTLAHQSGAYAEVVSRMEYELARRMGNSGNEIVFNGLWKSEEDLELALLEGAKLNLDSFYEIEHIARIAKRHPGRSFSVALRVAFPMEESRASRFGFDTANGDAFRAAKLLRDIGNVRLNGMHCHFTLADRSAEQYARMSRRMIEIAEELFGGELPEYIDIGGGFYSRMPEAMKGQFSGAIPEMEEYGEAVGKVFASEYGSDGPELILEPGLAVVADTMVYAATVLEIKQREQGCFASCTGSVYNIRPTKSSRNLPLRVVPAKEGEGRQLENCTIGGYTCMEDDVMHRGYSGPLASGDTVIFGNVGAYTLVLKPPFILPNDPVFEVRNSEQGPKIELISRRESLDYLFCHTNLSDSTKNV